MRQSEVDNSDRQPKVDVIKQPIQLEELISSVDGVSSKGDHLTRLADSVMVASELDDLGDRLIDHYVGLAREAGASWADIGSCLGVTKQAAQKRFVAPRGGWGRSRKGIFTRFAGEARAAVIAAQDHARAAGDDHIGTEHLLLGILDDPDSRGARALSALEVTPEKVGAGANPAGKPPRTGHIPFSPDAKKVLELSLREAIRSDSRHISTEHILVAILRDPGSPGGEILDGLGVTSDAVETWLGETAA